MFSHPSKRAKANDPCFCASGKTAQECCGPSLPIDLNLKDLSSQAVLIDKIAIPHATKEDAYINYLVWSTIEKATDLYPQDSNNIRIATMTGCGSTNHFFSMIKIDRNGTWRSHLTNTHLHATIEESLESLLRQVTSKWLAKAGKPRAMLKVLDGMMKRMKELAAEEEGKEDEDEDEEEEDEPEEWQEVLTWEVKGDGEISTLGGERESWDEVSRTEWEDASSCFSW